MNSKFEKTLRLTGFLVPNREEDVEAFEQAINEHNIPPAPHELDDITSIITNTKFNEQKPLSTSTQSLSSQQQFAMAARIGKVLPDSILQRMQDDIDESRKKKL